MLGVFASSCCVYGALGRSSTSAVGPSSTIRPSVITATRSAIVRISARLCVMNSSDEAHLRAQLAQQVDDRRLHRHVERRRDLVAHHQVGLGRQRPRDRHALALAAGELVRVAARPPRPTARPAPGTPPRAGPCPSARGRTARAGARPSARPSGAGSATRTGSGTRTGSRLRAASERERAAGGSSSLAQADRRPCSPCAARRRSARASSCPSPTRRRAPGTRAGAPRARSRTACGASPWWASRPRIASTSSGSRSTCTSSTPPSTGTSRTRLVGVVAARAVAGLELERRRELAAALVGRERAARARRSTRRAGRPAAARSRGCRRPRACPARSGTARSSRRVYGWRAAPNSWSRVPDLDDPPGVHHRDAVGQLGDHGQVVAHVQRRDAVAAAQVAHRLEHARLRRDVEAGRRLVADDHVRPAGERHRDRDALLLAARQLVRVAREERVVGRQRDLLERLAHARVALLVAAARRRARRASRAAACAAAAPG